MMSSPERSPNRYVWQDSQRSGGGVRIPQPVLREPEGPVPSTGKVRLQPEHVAPEPETGSSTKDHKYLKE